MCGVADSLSVLGKRWRAEIRRSHWYVIDFPTPTRSLLKGINIALLATGVDYFQVLAFFANSRVSWPPMIKDLFTIRSAFDLNIEITASACAIPDMNYPTNHAVADRSAACDLRAMSSWA